MSNIDGTQVHAHRGTVYGAADINVSLCQIVMGSLALLGINVP